MSDRIQIPHPRSPIDIIWLEPELAEVTRPSPLTGEPHSMLLPVTKQQVLAYFQGSGLIQEVFSHLTQSQREFLQTGYTQEDWDRMFPEED